MGLETATYIHELVETNPLGSDAKSQGDDHLRLIKEALKEQFPSEGIFRDYAAGNDTDPVFHYAYKSRGTLGAPAAIASADFFKKELVYGHDGTQFILAGGIYWQSTGTVATDRIAAKWQLYLHPDSTSAARKVLEVTEAGVVDLPFGQVKFPATQNASSDANVLDDYEEFTWTPIDDSGAALSFPIAAGVGTKIGNRVFADANLAYPATASGATSTIGGFPFTVHNSEAARSGGRIAYTNVATLETFLLTKNSTNGLPMTAGGATITNATLTGANVYLSLNYQVAA